MAPLIFVVLFYFILFYFLFSQVFFFLAMDSKEQKGKYICIFFPFVLTQVFGLISVSVDMFFDLV